MKSVSQFVEGTLACAVSGVNVYYLILEYLILIKFFLFNLIHALIFALIHFAKVAHRSLTNGSAHSFA